MLTKKNKTKTSHHFLNQVVRGFSPSSYHHFNHHFILKKNFNHHFNYQIVLSISKPSKFKVHAPNKWFRKCIWSLSVRFSYQGIPFSEVCLSVILIYIICLSWRWRGMNIRHCRWLLKSSIAHKGQSIEY